MRALVILFSLTVALAAQGTPDRPFPNHEQPPADWFCVPGANAKDVETNAHACECRGMYMDDPAEHCKKAPILDDDGNQVGEYVPENPKCKVHCHKSHCHCAARCETT